MKATSGSSCGWVSFEFYQFRFCLLIPISNPKELLPYHLEIASLNPDDVTTIGGQKTCAPMSITAILAKQCLCPNELSYASEEARHCCVIGDSCLVGGKQLLN